MNKSSKKQGTPIKTNDQKDIEDMLCRLKRLYEKIPSIECRHCHACSSPIFWFYPEEINIRRYLKQNDLQYITWTQEEFKHHKMQCPYLIEKRCSIYPVRPLVCRLQGIIEELPCTFFPTPLISQEEVKQIKEEMNQILVDMNSLDKTYGTRKIFD